jgi:hypothetical protein
MKLTKDCENITNYLITNNYINYPNHLNLKKISKIITHLYEELKKAGKYIDTNLLKEIQNPLIKENSISKPKSFHDSSFPEKIMAHINSSIKREICYTFSLFSRTIKVYFLLENIDSTFDFTKYIRNMLLWFYLLNNHASPECSKTISVFIYLTSLTKQLPSEHGMPMNQYHANTGFTRTCVVNSEIVIYRKEEWFKVFIHESFHNFALDFSDMDVSSLNTKILTLFPIKSDVTIFEAYTEFWAEIMNAVLCSYIISSDFNNYLINCEFFINMERHFGFLQMVKILDHLGHLKYDNIISNSNIEKREKYSEETNVLSYYIITMVLMNNFTDFILWCQLHNKSLFQFTKSEKNLDLFFDFIRANYKTESLLNMVHFSEQLLDKFKSDRKMSKTCRMTLCEI